MTYLFELEHSINSEIRILKIPLESALNIMKMLLHEHKTLKTSKTCLTTLTHQNMLYNLNWRKKDSIPVRDADTRSGVCLIKTRKKTKITNSQISRCNKNCLTSFSRLYSDKRSASACSLPLWWGFSIFTATLVRPEMFLHDVFILGGPAHFQYWKECTASLHCGPGYVMGQQIRR